MPPIWKWIAGAGKVDPNIRDINKFETILSGDLASDDIDFTNLSELTDEPSRAENSYHVVTGQGIDASAVLDGFTITAGNSNGPYLDMGAVYDSLVLSFNKESTGKKILSFEHPLVVLFVVWAVSTK